MSASILVAYATRYGSTEEVAEAIAATLRENGLPVDCRSVRDVRDMAGYSAVVLGAPLYMYRWHRAARRFVSRHREALRQLPLALFALGPTHDPHDEEEWRESRTQLDKELSKFPWLTPIALELFGGQFDPENLRFPLNVFAGQEPATDIRDWSAIRNWANELAAKLERP
jgi:menaquinone-dependent protoporphyrinogen oxidase